MRHSRNRFASTLAVLFAASVAGDCFAQQGVGLPLQAAQRNAQLAQATAPQAANWPQSGYPAPWPIANSTGQPGTSTIQQGMRPRNSAAGAQAAHVSVENMLATQYQLEYGGGAPAYIGADDQVSAVQNAGLAERVQQMEAQMQYLQTTLAAERGRAQGVSYAADSQPVEYFEAAEQPLAEQPAAKPEDPLGMSGKWNNGLEFSSKNKDFKIHVGGRSQIDAVFFEDSPEGFAGAGGIGDQDSVNLRRGRLRVDGTMYKYYDFACEYDLVNEVNDNVGLQPPGELAGNIMAVPVPTDFWVTARELPWVGNFRIGNFKPPVGFEHLTSSRYLDFMERSFNQEAFYGPFDNGFAPGVMVYDTYAEERGTWALGGFKSTTNPFAYGVGDGEYNATGRVTFLPFYDEASKGRYLLHLGMGGQNRDTNDERIRFRSRGSLRNGSPGPLNPVFADTGTFFADSQNLISPEVAVVMGPWLFQAEYTGSWVADALGNTAPNVGVPQGSVYMQGYYVEALCFLTGEHREYERKSGNFGRVIPHQNASITRDACGNCNSAPGAWQVGVRYSQLDLTDKAIDGGKIHDVTVGLNWFINPNMKYQWNYVYMHRDAPGALPEGDVHGAGMRLAFDF